MTASQEKTAGRLVVEALIAEGTDIIFGIPGSHVLSIYDALADHPSIRHITAKHENNASLMADLYGRLTRRPGVCIVTAGPGATNALSGVAQAYVAASPMVVVTGAVELRGKKESFHGVDGADFLEKIYANVTKRSWTVQRIEDIPEVMSQAFSLATSGRPGPVFVSIPEDVMRAKTDQAPPYRQAMAAPMKLAEGIADEIARVLRGAERPVICAGKGILAAGAARELAALAELLSAPVVFPQDALGALPYDHPLCVGCLATVLGPNPFGFEMMKQSDALLAVGLRASVANVDPVIRNAPKNFVFIGVDDEPNLVPEAAISCVADNKLALQALISRLEKHKRPFDQALGTRIERHKATIKDAFHVSIAAHANGQAMHFGLAVEELARQIDKDAIVVGDVGNHGVWAVNYLPRIGVDNLFQVGTWGAMGFAIPGAIAAKLVHPDRQVIAVTGDGAFLMASADFVTAVEYCANVVFILLDDRRYGMVNVIQNREFGRSYCIDIDAPDFIKYAESFGAMGIRVEKASELGPAIQKALRADRPVIVDVVCDPLVPYVSMPEAVGRARS